MVELVDSYFPEWANLYHSLPFNIQRLDMIRYMILYCHGGVYVDLDIECFKSIDPLVENKSFFLGMEPPEHWVCFNGSKQRVVGNAFMGSSNNHKGWLRILAIVQARGMSNRPAENIPNMRTFIKAWAKNKGLRYAA